MAADVPIHLGLLKHTPLGDLWGGCLRKGIGGVEWADQRSALMRT